MLFLWLWQPKHTTDTLNGPRSGGWGGGWVGRKADMIAIRPGACVSPPLLSALESDVGEKHTHVRSRLGRVQLFISRTCRGKASPSPPRKPKVGRRGGKTKQTEGWEIRRTRKKREKIDGYEVRGRKCRRHNLCLCRDVFIAFLRRVYKSVTAIFTSEQSDMSAF